ncbi:HD domain-containing protein [Nocardia sp. NPDC050406]|uniref:HD domain-containing protein n=1 Tax=Nocardia sp. NPDC050406 TaxID=3364318 RepID=UPI00378EDA6E
MISAATLSAWAKSDRDGGSLSLVQHLADSAAVAGLVWDRWVAGKHEAADFGRAASRGSGWTGLVAVAGRGS